MTAAAQPCPGDCDNDQTVQVSELVTIVSLALQSTSPDACAAGDLNGNHTIDVAELIASVDSALRGCIDTPLTPSPTATVAPTARPTLSADSALYREFDSVSRGACLRDRVQILEGLLSFGCTTGRGHNASLTIETFPDLETADARFEELASPGAPTEYKEFPAVYWEEGAQFPPFQPREHLVWLANCVVVNVQSFNESPYGAVSDARELSDIMVSWIRGYVARSCIH